MTFFQRYTYLCFSYNKDILINVKTFRLKCYQSCCICRFKDWYRILYLPMELGNQIFRLLITSNRKCRLERKFLELYSWLLQLLCWLRFSLWCITLFLTLFQFYRGCQFYWWRKTRIPRENHWLLEMHWQTWSHSTTLKPYLNGIFVPKKINTGEAEISMFQNKN